MSDSQLNLESKTEISVAKAQHYIEGDTAQKKCKPHILPKQVDKRGGGTPHIKIRSHVRTWVGTPHTISNISRDVRDQFLHVESETETQCTQS